MQFLWAFENRNLYDTLPEAMRGPEVFKKQREKETHVGEEDKTKENCIAPPANNFFRRTTAFFPSDLVFKLRFNLFCVSQAIDAGYLQSLGRQNLWWEEWHMVGQQRQLRQ